MGRFTIPEDDERNQGVGEEIECHLCNGAGTRIGLISSGPVGAGRYGRVKCKACNGTGRTIIEPKEVL